MAITEETHAKISNATTNFLTNGPSNTVLKETIAATNLELESTGEVVGLGTLANESFLFMWVTTTTDANGITYKGVIVKAPAGKGCKVFEDKEGKPGAEGVIKTKPLRATTGSSEVEEGVEGVVIEPVTKTVFATFFIEKCEAVVPEALRGKWEITGKIFCPTQGATIICNHSSVTLQNTLKGKGAKAGLEGKATVTAGKFPTGEPTNPVSVTTTFP